LLFLLPQTEDRAKQSNLSAESNENGGEANNSQEEESELTRNVRKKKRTTISYEESLLQILRQEKIEDIGADEEKCFILSLLPSFWQLNNEQNFVSRMEILKIMPHVKLQQNLIRTHLAPCLPFQTPTCPSKHIALVQYLSTYSSRASKTTNFHNCHLSVSN
jgi:hypothetical protein